MLTQTVIVQEGVWIDGDVLLQAGLDKQQLQIIIQAGAVWLTMASNVTELQTADMLSTEPYRLEHDPLIGLFDGPENLSQDVEAILQKEVVENSGLTWKT